MISTTTLRAADRVLRINVGRQSSEISPTSTTTAGRRTVIGGTFARTNLPQAFGSATYNDANRLTQKGSTSFTYDANGNLTSDGANTYTWNARNQLTSISGPSVNASFNTTRSDRRINKTINGASTTYLFDDFNVVKETTTSSTVDFLATGWDECFLRTDGGGTFGIPARRALDLRIALS